nr:hypothetical protein [Tanacetum cinerariifolium]
MGEITFFLGLQVKQKQDGIFISQDKYVAEILRKFGLTDGKSASTPIDTEKPLLKDPDGEDVDLHAYRSMIGSLMYLTSSRPDIMFAICAYLPFNLVAYSDSDYAGASLDRKYTRGDQTVSGKDSSNPLMADNLPKIVLFSTHHVALMKSWLLQKQTAIDGIEVSVVGLKLLGQAIFNAVSSKLLLFGLMIDAANLLLLGHRKSNDVVRLQALMDRKKVIITKDSIRQALLLDDADSVDCLPNEEIFAELARMGYEKPSINSSMASAVICLATVGDLSFHNTKYTSPALAQKVFANMRRVGKGFSRTCATLTKQVANLEQDKVAQAKEITKLKQRVRRLEKKRQFKSSGLKRLRKGRLDESQAKVYHLDLEHADKVLSMQESDEAEPAEVEEVIKVVTVAKLMTEVVTTATTTTIVAPVPKASAPRKRRGVIIQDPKEAATASLSVQSDVKSKDKGKGILVEEPKPLKRQKGKKEIKEEESKRKSKNLEQKAAKKKKINEETEELKTHLKIVPNDEDDVYNKATLLALKIP